MIEEAFLHSPFHDGDLRYIYQMRNRTFTGSLWNELALVWNCDRGGHSSLPICERRSKMHLVRDK